MSTVHFALKKPSIDWLSFPEDKFYKDEFELPADTIRALFKQGYYSRKGGFLRYSKLVVNVYPKDGVALWMKAGVFLTALTLGLVLERKEQVFS